MQCIFESVDLERLVYWRSACSGQRSAGAQPHGLLQGLFFSQKLCAVLSFGAQPRWAAFRAFCSNSHLVAASRLSACRSAPGGATSAQVLRLGEPVTALSLSPAMDLLATAHVGHRGLYLWANALVYGRGAEAVPSEAPIDARLPALAAGAPLPWKHAQGAVTAT